MVLMPRLGHNRAFVVTPICCLVSAVMFLFISDLDFYSNRDNPGGQGGLRMFSRLFLKDTWNSMCSIGRGAKVVLSHRDLVWLLPAYGLLSYGHRFMDATFPYMVAEHLFGNTGWSQLITIGSNIGTLAGALMVLIITRFTTPIFWLRLDAVALLTLWILPFWKPPPDDLRQVVVAAVCLIPTNMGYSASTATITPYIQDTVIRLEPRARQSSCVRGIICVMYCLEVALYGGMRVLMERLHSSVPADGNIQSRLVFTAGVQFTIISTVVMASTFIPFRNGPHGEIIEEDFTSGDIPLEEVA